MLFSFNFESRAVLCVSAAVPFPKHPFSHSIPPMNEHENLTTSKYESYL